MALNSGYDIHYGGGSTGGARTASTDEPTVPNVNKRYEPAEDFFRYVNGKWLAESSVPPYLGSFGVSEEIEEDVRTDLIAAIQERIKSHPHSPLSKLAHSVLHGPIQSSGLIDLNRLLSAISCVDDSETIARAIGAMNRIQCYAPVSFVIGKDSSGEGKQIIFLYEVQVGLPEKSFYKGKEHEAIRKSYTKLLHETGKAFHIDGLEEFLDLETSLLPVLSNVDSVNDLSFNYTVESLHELQRGYRHIPWESLLAGWGMSTKGMKYAKYAITNTKYFHFLNHAFKTMSKDAWRLFLRGLAVISYIEYLPPPFDDLHFELYGKLIRGKTQKLPQKFLMYNVLAQFAQQELGRLYVDTCVSPSIRSEITKMIHTLKAATKRRLTDLDWMEASTRRAAIAKIEAMSFLVGYPSSWQSEFKGVHIHNDRPIANLFALGTGDTATMIAEYESGKPDDLMKWQDGVFEVNAYYYPEKNQMIIPAGTLRAPFYDPTKSAGWNYGGIGAAIGHEITHGFDAEGRFYDKTGVKRDWWTAHDSRKFTALTKALVRLFDGAEYMKGEVDGEKTLSENLADLGGMAIALQALMTAIEGKDRKKELQDFFRSFAVSWRNKDRPTKALRALREDVHAPAVLRVNLIVRQFAEFYEAFDITPDAVGFIKEEERVKLW